MTAICPNILDAFNLFRYKFPSGKISYYGFTHFRTWISKWDNFHVRPWESAKMIRIVFTFFIFYSYFIHRSFHILFIEPELRYCYSECDWFLVSDICGFEVYSPVNKIKISSLPDGGITSWSCSDISFSLICVDKTGSLYTCLIVLPFDRCILLRFWLLNISSSSLCSLLNRL